MKAKTLARAARRILLAAAVAAGAAFAADAADARGISLKVTGVAAVDDTEEGLRGARFLPPGTRVVVSSPDQIVLFRIEYETPADMNVRIFLEENGDTAGLGCGFGTGASGLYSGAGTVSRPLHLYGDVYEKGVSLKSVRLFYGTDSDDGMDTHYVCDTPVDVLFAKDGDKKTDGFHVLEPLPPPPAKSASLLPGWTEDFKAAKARAAKEGKLVLAYFLNSRPGKEGKPTAVLDHEVLGSREFLERAGKSYVCFMAELYKPGQSWIAKGHQPVAFKYASRRRVFSPPEIAIIHPDGSRVAIAGRNGWEGGVEGYLAKIEKARKAGLARRERENKARKAAAKKVPQKKDSTSTPAGFTDNLDEALAKAKAEGKLVYACFSGSDWCGWCMKLEREVLSKQEFIDGVKNDFVLVFIDSPQDKAVLSERAKAENGKLTKKYGIQGFPTALILDGDGKKIAETGYRRGGAAEYAKHLKSIRAGASRPGAKNARKPRKARLARKGGKGKAATTKKDRP